MIRRPLLFITHPTNDTLILSNLTSRFVHTNKGAGGNDISLEGPTPNEGLFLIMIKTDTGDMQFKHATGPSIFSNNTTEINVAMQARYVNGVWVPTFLGGSWG